MSFAMEIADSFGESCDICRKIDDSRPMLLLMTKGRTYEYRNFIWVHLDEFEAKLARLKKKRVAAAHGVPDEKTA